MYKRVLLKLSGEALSAADFPFSIETLDDIARQVKQIVNQGVKVGIVVGGGNICRGRIFETLGFDRVESDYTGMLATVINAKFISESLNKVGVQAVALSAIDAESIEKFDVSKSNEYLDKGFVTVFGGGVGKPYHSTDTGSAQRAKDINAEVILMAKSGTDGVYDSDPNKNPNAKRFDKITYQEILDNNLQVIDLQAAKLCLENKIESFVFNMNEKDSLIKAVNKDITGTIITF